MKLSDENNNDNNVNNDFEKGVLLETKPKTKKPSMYNVLLLNDDYTPHGIRCSGFGECI